jgi:hypothetical protein
MKIKPLLLITCIILAVSARSICAQEAQGQLHHELVFRYDSAMLMFNSPSTRLFVGWQSNANAVLQLGLEGVSGSIHFNPAADGLLRFGVLAIFSGAGLVVSQAFSLTAHDQAHMEAARAIGASGIGLLRTNNGQPMSIWEFFWESFNVTAEPGLYTYTKSNPTLAELAYVCGEGLDTNMLIAQDIGRKITEGAGHVTDLAPYLLNKLWGINYFSVTGPTSDAENYMNLVNSQGYGTIARENVIILSVAACLLSGGFLSLAKGSWDFVVQGEAAVTALRLDIGELILFWPEFTVWLNPDNISLYAALDAAWKGLLALRAGMDVPVFGNTAQNPEMTLGVKAKIQRLSLCVEITSRFVRLPFFLGSAELDISDAWSIGIEGFYGQRNTMREIREYPLGPGALLFLKMKV